MYEINRDKQLELLRWLLTTLDGQWLSKTAAVYGPGEASKLNGRVRSTMGRTEMKAMLSLVGKNRAENLGQATEIIKTYLSLVYGERGFSGTFRPVVRTVEGHERLEIELVRFTAMDAIKKVYQATGEQVGLVAEGFWSAWFETLLPDEQIEVSVRSEGTGPELIIVTASSASFIPPLEEELSPIAAALQIPLEQIQPASPTPASSLAPAIPPSEYSPASQPPAPVAGWPPINPLEKPTSYPFTKSYVYRPEADPTQVNYSKPTEAPRPEVAPSPVNYSKPTEAPRPEVPNPVIGASEPGADRKVAGALNQRLARSQKPADNSDLLPPGTPPALEAPAVPPNALRVNPDSGRPLFTENPDEDAKRSVEKRKSQKGFAFMSRLMLSKEAQELLKESEDERPLQPFSMVGGVEMNLQRLIGQELARQPGSIIEPVHVVDGPEGDLEIHIGRQVYNSVGEVPPGRILELLQQAVAEWMDSQEG